MGQIVVSTNVTLDGVVQDPTGDEGFARGGWFTRIGDKDRAAWADVEFEEALRADALLLGGRSYAWFAARWASRDGAWADRLRSLPKYVVSSSPLQGPDWGNATVLTGDLRADVSALRHRVSGEIVVYASGRLVRALLEHDLVDELRLMTCPFVIGAGQRLFGETTGTKALRLVDSRVVGDGLALSTYRPASPRHGR